MGHGREMDFSISLAVYHKLECTVSTVIEQLSVAYSDSVATLCVTVYFSHIKAKGQILNDLHRLTE